ALLESRLFCCSRPRSWQRPNRYQTKMLSGRRWLNSFKILTTSIGIIFGQPSPMTRRFFIRVHFPSAPTDVLSLRRFFNAFLSRFETDERPRPTWTFSRGIYTSRWSATWPLRRFIWTTGPDFSIGEPLY